MNRKSYRTSIPRNAVEVVDARYDSGAKKSSSYFMGGEKVGCREWDEEGSLDWEFALRDGVRHGNCYRFYPDGQVLEFEHYRNGREHGTGKQWTEDGRLLVTWTLKNGTGLDLWCDTRTETLAEEMYWPPEGKLGYVRQWNPDEKTVWQEFYLLGGKGYHGVWREWNEKGRMRRGLPQFYIEDKRVTKQQYLKACEADRSLPRYRPLDDGPQRKLPKKYVAQRKKRRRR